MDARRVDREPVPLPTSLDTVKLSIGTFPVLVTANVSVLVVPRSTVPKLRVLTVADTPPAVPRQVIGIGVEVSPTPPPPIVLDLIW